MLKSLRRLSTGVFFCVFYLRGREVGPLFCPSFSGGENRRGKMQSAEAAVGDDSRIVGSEINRGGHKIYG